MATNKSHYQAVRKYQIKNQAQLNLRIDKELMEQVKAKSAATGVSVRSVIIQALKEFINS